jgi:hypothetical protein
MISYCPFCSKALPKPLNNGVSFCSFCVRVIVSSKENELLSAYRVLISDSYRNENQFKSALKIDSQDYEFIKSCEENGLSIDEFTKYIRSKIV